MRKQALNWQAANISPTPAEIHNHACLKDLSRGTQMHVQICVVRPSDLWTVQLSQPKEEEEQNQAITQKDKKNTLKRNSTKSPIS